MPNDVIDKKNIDKNKDKNEDFNEEEAYSLLCEIISYAQATHDYAKFQTDLSEWKKRYPIDLFSEKYKSKIMYMLSEEFLDKILKDFIAFDKLSQKDPSVGLKKLRKILANAENHKNESQLDSDLKELYSEYPLDYLKEKYPHIVGLLLSKSYREKTLQKFDSELAFKELESLLEPTKYNSADEFKATINNWKELFPVEDFNDKYNSQVEKKLSNALDEQNLEALFPNNLNLDEGEIIPIDFNINPKEVSIAEGNALHDFFNIVDANIGDVDSLFDWICNYSKYLNTLSVDAKNTIVSNLMSRYSNELPPATLHYKIPKIDSNPNDFITLENYSSIEQTKKNTLLQVLGILSTGKKITVEDKYRLNIIKKQAKQYDMIKKANIEKKLDAFVEEFPKENLTISDPIYFKKASADSVDLSISNNVDLSVSDKNNVLAATDIEIHNETTSSFKETLKVGKTLEKVNSKLSSSGNNSSNTSSGGSSQSVPQNSSSELSKISEDENDLIEKHHEEETSNAKAVSSIQAIILEPSTVKASFESSTDNVIEEDEMSCQQLDCKNKSKINNDINLDNEPETNDESKSVDENQNDSVSTVFIDFKKIKNLFKGASKSHDERD